MAFWNFSNKQEKTDDIQPVLAGIDLGYGQVKIFSGNKIKKFISAVGTPISTFGRTAAVVTDSELLDRLSINWNGQTYYLGKNAITNTRNGRLTLRQNKTATEHNVVKLLTGLALLMEEDQEYAEFDVVTGLPVLEYNNEAENLKHVILNSGKPFVFDMYYGPKTVKKTIKIRQATIISQGEGAFYDFILNKKGEIVGNKAELVSGTVMVVDIGYRTTDIVTMENGSYIETLSDQLNKGVNSIHQEVLRLIMQNLGVKKELKEMDQIVRTGNLFHNTKETDVTRIIDSVAVPFAEDISENLHIISNDQLGSVNHVILTGGGAEIVYPFVGAQLKNVVESSVMENAEFCNASGYYKYGLLLKSAGEMQ